jgi:cell surface protein SprA
LKRKGQFGYKFLFFIALAAAIANAAARTHRPFFVYFIPGPDTPATKNDTLDEEDTAHKLKFPIYDQTGDPQTDYNRPRSMDLSDPKNVNKGFEYVPDSNRYEFTEKLGNGFLRNPTYLTYDEYQKYQQQRDMDAYWQRRMDGLMLFNKTPELPQMYKDGLFDRIFGNNTIQVKPQGNVDVTFGGNWQNIKNPTLVQSAQKYGVFDFDMQMNINLLATVGDKLKFNISNNTKATFDYQNVQKLDYSGKEDEMLKKIEAGNISFPLKSTLISGVQSLFGLKTQLQFGKLWVTAVLSQQKSQRKSLTVQGGAQAQQIAIKADNYDENKDFLLGQYFHDNYDAALANFPVINSLVTINRIEVWVTNKTGAVTGVRNIVGLMDLGEANPYDKALYNASSGVRNGLPDNSTNRLYTEIQQTPLARLQSSSNTALSGLGLHQGEDFETTFARELSSTEYTFNSQLGYIMLNTQLNPDDVVGVAYRYTYRGKVYQVGEFAEDLPPDTSNSKVLFLKLLKGTSARPQLPVWKLMMKNIYTLGGLGVTKDNFTLNILYQDPGGGEKRYMPEGPLVGIPFLTILNLDRLNSQGEAHPDGIFDFVDGITINSAQGKIIFPKLEPFGTGLDTAFGTGADAKILKQRYSFQVLYDSTKTVAQESQNTDRYILRGTYKSSSSSDIFLGGFNIPPGSVTVSAGGTKLIENQDYSIDYGLGKLKILNTGILNSGVPINVQYEDNATFGFQQQNLMAARVDYYVNKNLTLGGTIMRLNERPFTQQVSYGDDPIKNTVIGLDANYQSEEPAITRALDKLPVYSTTSPSFFNGALEVAALLPGHPKQIDALDPEGSVYIDNFEGTTSSYDLKFPAVSWSLSSTPAGAVNKFGQTLFPEAYNDDQLSAGINRAKLAWYTLEPTLVDPGSSVPAYVKLDRPGNLHYIRMVQQQDVFPNLQTAALQSALSTFDLAYYPAERGPYNFDVNPSTYSSGINPDGTLVNPASRWGGITRPIDNTDFEASNVEYIQFWVMDPFLNDSSMSGSLYFDLGDVSEDVLKDSRMFFENSIPNPFDNTKLDTTIWGYVPKFEQQITRAFDNDPNARVLQDVGYDGLPDIATQPGQLDEQHKFAAFLNQLGAKLGATNPAYTAAQGDPSNDDYHYYRGSDYDAANNGNGLPVLARYKKYNNPQGNSPISDPNASYSTAETTIPESEDINRDNTLNENESYFQYRVDLSPAGMQVGSNYIINIEDTTVLLPTGGSPVHERWYQFKIPIENYDHKIGGISDFRSIRFMRMFLAGWTDSVILRFATLELGRNQWRNYNYSLATPGENLPQQNQGLTDFSVTSVSIEENGSRYPIPYVIPPGVSRQITSVSSGQNVQLNEQALSLKTCALQDGDARAVYKTVNVDMRQFTYLRMFMHAETVLGSPIVNSGDVDAFIRIGSDFTDNYYEYRMPLTITAPGSASADIIWPASNEMDIVLQDLVTAKKNRDAKGIQTNVPYSTTDTKGNTIIVVGNPNIGGAKDLMLGVLNPKKSSTTAGDDGLPKCTEVWFDELRMAGINDQAGYAAAGKVALQLADLGNVNASGSMHTAGYGNIDQKIEQRSQDNYDQFNTSTNLNLGKLFPKEWGVVLPFFLGYTQSVSNPKYDPNDEDVLVSDELKAAKSSAQRDSIKNATQDFTSITSFNLTNVRIQGNSATPSKKIRMPWSIKNFDFSFSYNDQYKHNPTVAMDRLVTERLGIGYNYSIKIKPVEPFKNLIKSKSKWFALVKDFNFTPLPSTFTIRNDLNRANEETVVRNIDDNSGYVIPPTFYQNFTWTRLYTVRWDLTKSLSLDYSATNISRVDQPYGLLDTKQKVDSLLGRLATFGHPTSYSQTFNASYKVPLAKLPLTDWINVQLGYSASYSWTGAAPVAYELGNTIGNTQTKKFTGDLNLTTLYNKSKWLRALNTPPVNKTAPKSGVPGGGSQSDNKTIKDLRKPPAQGSLLPGANSGDVNDAGTGGNAQGGNNNPQGGNGQGSNGNQNAGGQPGGGNGTANSVNGNTGNNAGGGTTAGNNTNNNPGGNNPPGNPGNGNGKPPDSTNVSPGNISNNNNGAGNIAGTGNNANNGNNGKSNKNTGNTNNNAGAQGTNNGNNSTGANGVNANNFNSVFQGINTANLTDAQLDSLVQLQADQDAAKAAALRAKQKAARKAARKLRRAKMPTLTPAEDIIGHILTMVTHVTLNYTQTGGTILPGYLDSTRFMGVNNYSGAPGFNFVYGYQPDYSWLAKQAAAGRLTTDSLFNAQFQQTYSRNINASATLQPFKNFRVDLTLSQSFSKSHSELYADTGGSGGFNHFNPYETGSFNVSYIALSSMFKNTDAGSGIFNAFLADGPIISKRLGMSNPYTNGTPDPANPGYYKGYGPFSQDVLIPSFLAAFTGQNPSTAALLDYNHDNITDNPFKFFNPMPNWKITYTGLSKLPFFSNIFSNFVINHAYTGTLSMNGFNSNLLFNDLYGLGFPSFIDSNSHNYVPFFQVPNVTISQAFNPLVGFDASFKNNLTAKFEVRESKMEALSLIDYQVSSNQSTEYVIGMGFRKKGIMLPFRIFGYQKLKNELIVKVDLGLRNDISSNTFLSNNISVISRGQKVIRISPTVDYSVTQNLTLHFFFDRQQTIPYVSNSYPTTTTRAGLTLRFIFAK